MKIKHFILIILLTAIWGFNFVVTKFGLQFMPPFLFAGIRFFLASFPAVFFIKPPDLPLKIIASYGIITFGLQFALLFLGISLGITAGVASLLFQIQIFFSILFAVVFLNEKIVMGQIWGGVVAFTGILIIGVNLNNKFSLSGFVLILMSAIAWAGGSVIPKKFHDINFLSLMVWGGIFAWPLLLVLSLIFDGSKVIMNSFLQLDLKALTIIIYMAYIATILSFYIWNLLVKNYPISIVVPFCLLVPIFGLFFSIILLKETLDSWKILASIFVITGLAINYYYGINKPEHSCLNLAKTFCSTNSKQ